MAKKNQLSVNQILMLSYYRSSEIAGALFFGRLCRQVKDPELIYFLTEQFMEESNHALMWTKLLFKYNAVPVQMHSTYQSNYAKYITVPSTMTEILLITKVFEARVAERFQFHLQQADTPQPIKTTIKLMLDEEESHINWLNKRIKQQAEADNQSIDKLEAQYLDADLKAYNEIIANENNLVGFFQ